jgi:hypothetical protein
MVGCAMPPIWTVVYQEGDLVGVRPADSREAALAAARVMKQQGRIVLAIRNGKEALDVAEIERSIGPAVRL